MKQGNVVWLLETQQWTIKEQEMGKFKLCPQFEDWFRNKQILNLEQHIWSCYSLNLNKD